MNIRITYDPRVRTLFPAESSGATAARAAARAALDAGIAPKTPPIADQTSAVVFIGHDLRQMIQARHPDTDLRTTFEGLAYGYVLANTAVPTQAAVSRYTELAPTSLPLSALQQQMLAGIYRAFESRGIALAEGSTGIGKTRVIAVAAAAAANNGERVVVAVPSVAVLAQLMATWTELDTGMTASPLLGRGQFVDPALVRFALTEGGADGTHDAHSAAVAAWIDEGGPSYSPLGAIAWLRDSLLHVAPEFPIGDCLHSRDTPESPAEAVYQTLRTQSATSRVVFTTHAMIATHMRLLAYGGSDGLLGPIQTLLIDEAHQLESTIGDAFTDRLSIFRLRSRLRHLDPGRVKAARAGAAITRLMDVAESAFSTMQGAFGEHRTTVVSSNASDPRTEAQRQAIAALVARIEAEAATLERVDKDLAMSITALAQRIARGSPSILVQFSPVRGYPSLAIGPASLAKPLQAFWGAVERAALLSATLYAPTAAGWSPNWTRSTLHIPAERCVPMQRMIEPWVYDALVMLPDLPAAQALVPSTDEDEGLSAPYLDALTAVVLQSASTAAGGVLVLLTSYTAIRGLAERLAPALADRLIVQQRGTPVGKYTRAFRSTARPVWLATGPAWTGIDLADPAVAPADDTLLTDVVIGRLPFRMAEAPLQYHRAQGMGQSATRIEASFTFRQGIGRLKRRKGTMHRRIWIADGRISAAGRHAHLADPCRRIIEEYQQRKHYSLPISV